MDKVKTRSSNLEYLAKEMFPPRSTACSGQAGRYDLYCTYNNNKSPNPEAWVFAPAVK